MQKTFFSSANGTFSKIDHILGHKSNVINLRKLKSDQASPDHNAMRLDINYKKKTKKHKHMEIKQLVSK